MNPERFQKLTRALRRRQPDLTVLMERVHKSHNLSAILRNCDAVGVLEAHAIPPEEGLQIHSHTSAGTAKWVRLVRHHTIQAAIKELKGEASGCWRHIRVPMPSIFGRWISRCPPP